jgi:succinyl-CoA synthetase alpha subunit
MSILVNENTKVIVQGITGREASEKLDEMIDYGTDVVAGVTPGKGGSTIKGVPVYDTVKQASKNHSFNTSLIYVPPFAALDAFRESADHVHTANIITERIPVKDAQKIVQESNEKNVDVVGPTSVGIISPGKTKVGPIGGPDAQEVYKKGRIGIISKSGGMTTETAWTVTQKGFGISTAAGLGGDVIAGMTFSDCIERFDEDKQTDAVVMFGELGGTYEEQAARTIEKTDIPVVGFIAGEFTEQLPSAKYGHAGAIIRGNRGQPSQKKKRLKEAGAKIAETHHKIPEKLNQVV